MSKLRDPDISEIEYKAPARTKEEGRNSVVFFGTMHLSVNRVIFSSTEKMRYLGSREWEIMSKATCSISGPQCARESNRLHHQPQTQLYAQDQSIHYDFYPAVNNCTACLCSTISNDDALLMHEISVTWECLSKDARFIFKTEPQALDWKMDDSPHQHDVGRRCKLGIGDEIGHQGY